METVWLDEIDGLSSPVSAQQLIHTPRSGSLLYLPDAARSCCPHYTIRLPASQFRAGKDQRQTLHRWNRYVLGDKYMKALSARPKTKEDNAREKDVFDLSATVHAPEISKLPSEVDTKPEHTFEVKLEHDTFTNEKFDLFSDYQQNVHHESPTETTKSGFRRFLCESALQRRTDASGKRLGSYHHCYRLDGRLIAMSVLDLLPHAVSGVYFIYHRDFEKWSLGKLSALRELALAMEERYEYYYMGYYIHSCMKMRYKGTYKPQYVLDFDNLEWDLLDDQTKELMEKRKWVSMSRERVLLRAQASSSSSDDSLVGTTNDDKDESKTTDADDFYPTYQHPSVLEATNSGLSLITLGMPGVMLDPPPDLGRMRLRLGPATPIMRMDDIVAWTMGHVKDRATIKGIVAELASCLGEEMTRKVVVDFGR
ncbi:Arginyl-tRNA--protein transferase 1 [Oleoguttula sp. CCFEE 5521]